MSLAHIVVTLPAAAMAGYSGIVVLTRAWGSPLWGRIVKALTDYRGRGGTGSARPRPPGPW